MNEILPRQRENDLPTDTADWYPSRTGQSAKLVDRLDPVVYANKELPAPVDQSLVERYENQGFVVVDGLFTSEETVRFQQELERLKADPQLKDSGEVITEPGSNEIRSVFRVHEHNPLFKALSADRRLADLARYLLDDEVYIHQSRLNYKPGLRGKEFYWHSDFETWHVEDGMPRMRAVSMSITLSENFEQNGPLMFMPGSHKQYAVCPGETPLNHYLQSLKKQTYGVPADDCLEVMAAQGGVVSVTGKPGSLVVFDCNLMHGSNGNITPFPRSNVFFVYNAISNKVVSPFCHRPARPEYICAREDIQPLGSPRTPDESVKK